MKDNPITKEVYEVLAADTDAIPYESVTSEEDSPLNQAVKDQHGKETQREEGWNIWKPNDASGTSGATTANIAGGVSNATAAHLGDSLEKPLPEAEPPLDAPEQEIGGDATGSSDPLSEKPPTTAAEEVFELPTATAKQAADTILGMSNNVLAVGGGFFIKIRKHKDFYEFEEIVELIDTQNEKNVKRIQLDKEDKALLKPILVAILKKKAKNLTPEQQLMGAVLSILIKKAQVVMEVRAENDILIDRILDIVREERGTASEEESEEEIAVSKEAQELDFRQMQANAQEIMAQQSQEEIPAETYDEDRYSDVVEVFDANPKDQNNDKEK